MWMDQIEERKDWGIKIKKIDMDFPFKNAN
jgi:hypothetical protein